MSKILIFGGLIMDRYYFVDHFPQRGGDAAIKHSLDFVGGCAINMAFTIKNLGGTPYIVSYVGEDEPGRVCLDYLRGKGLPGDCVRQVGSAESAGAPGNLTGQGGGSGCSCRTGYCLVFVEPGGERTFLTGEGCEGKFDQLLIPERVAEESGVAAVTGYYLLGDSGSGVVSFLEKLKPKGCSVLFDPGPMVDRIAADVLERIVDLADVITPNRGEAALLAGRGIRSKKENLKGKNTERWAKNVAASGTKVILTGGAGGGIAFEGNRRFVYDGIPAKTVDSTGAGDSFSGALAFGMAKGWSMEKSLAVAARCASLTAGIEGPHGEFDTSWAATL